MKSFYWVDIFTAQIKKYKHVFGVSVGKKECLVKKKKCLQHAMLFTHYYTGSHTETLLNPDKYTDVVKVDI